MDLAEEGEVPHQQSLLVLQGQSTTYFLRSAGPVYYILPQKCNKLTSQYKQRLLLWDLSFLSEVHPAKDLNLHDSGFQVYL